PPRSAEQEGVGQATLLQRTDQRTDDVLLPQDLVGTLGPVLAVEGLVVLVGHGDKQAIAPGRHRGSERSNRRFRGTLGGHDDRTGGRTAPRRPRLPSVLVGPDGVAGGV